MSPSVSEATEAAKPPPAKQGRERVLPFFRADLTDPVKYPNNTCKSYEEGVCYGTTGETLILYSEFCRQRRLEIMAGSGNKSLSAAIKNKQDEFYTQLTDIEKELRYYRRHFDGKTVFCNCDDPFESNFFKYFVLNFNRLGLKKLIATCYTGSPIANQQLSLFDIIEETPENEN